MLTTWKCMPLLWAGQKGTVTYTRYFCTWDALITCTPVSFHLGCGYYFKKKLLLRLVLAKTMLLAQSFCQWNTHMILFWSWRHYSCLMVVKTLSHAQTPPSSREEKGSGVTSPNPWATSRSVEWPMILQSSVYWNDAEARTSTSNTPPKVMLWNSLLTLTNRWDLGVRLKDSGLWHQTPSCISWVGSGHGTSDENRTVYITHATAGQQ